MDIRFFFKSSITLSVCCILATRVSAGDPVTISDSGDRNAVQGAVLPANADRMIPLSNKAYGRGGAKIQAVTEYDFTTRPEMYYGTNGAKDLGGGVYGMIAGDTDGSGTVDANDRSAAWNDRNKTGYEPADCDLSGTVDANDRSTTWNNRNKTTSVP
jgi:hypothetical protein